jgi:hypothetical protein
MALSIPLGSFFRYAKTMPLSWRRLPALHSLLGGAPRLAHGICTPPVLDDRNSKPLWSSRGPVVEALVAMR